MQNGRFALGQGPMIEGAIQVGLPPGRHQHRSRRPSTNVPCRRSEKGLPWLNMILEAPLAPAISPSPIERRDMLATLGTLAHGTHASRPGIGSACSWPVRWR
jgi:hypothetical protein